MQVENNTFVDADETNKSAFNQTPLRRFMRKIGIVYLYFSIYVNIYFLSSKTFNISELERLQVLIKLTS